MPSGLVRALHKSCRKILTEGLEARFARHARLADLLRRGLENLGCELLVPESDYQSNTVTAVRAHARIAPAELIRYLKEKHGILISGGLDRLAGKIFRIGHMGPTATPNAILPTLYGIEEALREAGAKVEPGQCLRGLPTPVLDAQTSRTHSA
jgi:alanine-glyoxylate transaminase/serine-glyoxylate transaminase/serine-pyruvate transaminase